MLQNNLMELELNNFLCHSHIKVNFIRGLNLIKGKNGVGKSTLLSGLKWILFGDKVTKLAKNVSGKLLLNDISIVRKRCPDRLEIIHEDVSYNDYHECQQLIDKIFCDAETWSLSCFLSQDSFNFLLNSSGQEKTQIIKHFCFLSEDPNHYIDKIFNELKRIKLEKVRIDAKYDSIKEVESKLLQTNEHVKEEKVNFADNTSFLEHISNKLISNENTTELINELKEIQSIRNKLKIRIEEETRKKITKENKTEELESKLKVFSSLFEISPKDINEKSKSIIELNKTLEKYRSNIEIKNRYQSFVSRNKKILSDYNLSVNDLNIEQLRQRKLELQMQEDIIVKNKRIEKKYNLNIASEKEFENQITSVLEFIERKEKYTLYENTLMLRNNLNNEKEKLLTNISSEKEQAFHNVISEFKAESKLIIPDIDEYENELKENTKLLKSKTLKCPECNKQVLYYAANCELLTRKNNFDVKSIEKRIKELQSLIEDAKRKQETIRDAKEGLIRIENKLNKFLVQKDASNKRIVEIDIQLNKIPDVKSVEKDKINLSLDQLKEKLNDLRKIKYVERSAQQSKDFDILIEHMGLKKVFDELNEEDLNENKITEIKQELKSNQQELEKMNELKSKYILYRDNCNKLQKEIENIVIKDGYEQELDECENNIIELNQKIEIMKQFENYRSHLTELVFLEKQVKETNHELIHLEILHHKSIEILHHQMESTVESITSITNQILTELYHEPVCFSLNLFTENNKNEYKPKINYLLQHKGNNHTNLNSGSGGEKRKLSLAITIAFNKIRLQNMLILDESMSSIDEDSRDLCFKILRKLQYETKSIVISVSHEDITGIYDNVIEL